MYTCFDIPAEETNPEDEGMVDKLNLSFYGTCDAALKWSDTKCLNTWGFRTSKGSPCNFWNAE